MATKKEIKAFANEIKMLHNSGIETTTRIGNMTDEAPTSKACTKCGVVKPLGDFSKEKIKKDGLQKYCKACNSTMAAKWRAENPEKVKTKAAKYRAENPEKVKAKNDKYRAENPEKVKAIDAKWRAKNPEKVKAIAAKWRAKNPEKVKAIAAKYRAENPEKVKAIDAKWRAKNPEKVKAKAAKYHAENPEKVKATTAKWRAENPEKVKAIYTKWRAENPEKVKAIYTKRYAKWRLNNPKKQKKELLKHKNSEYEKQRKKEWGLANGSHIKDKSSEAINMLKDHYVARQLGIPVSQCPPELLELKRAQLTLSRATNQLKKEMKNVE